LARFGLLLPESVTGKCGAAIALALK
jgi:hypothetical protein